MSEQKQSEPKQLTAIDRLEVLEREVAKFANISKVLQAIATQVQRTSGAVQSLGGNVDGVYKRLLALEAVLSESGGHSLNVEAVDVKMAEMESVRRQQQEENLVSQGLLSENKDGITAESYVAISQTDAQSNKVEVLREHIDMAHVEAGIKNLLLGKGVGAKVELDGKVLEVLRVLEPVKEGSLSPDSPVEESKV